MINFQVSPFPLSGKVALFRLRAGGVWKTQALQDQQESYVTREVVSVMSSDSGHFLLVLNGDELCTIREFCRIENCDFVEVVDQSRVPEAVEKQTSPQRQPRSFFPVSILQSEFR